VYERLMTLNWAFAIRFITVLSFGKRLSMDTIPSMTVITSSNHLGTIIGSYSSGPDRQIEVERDDATMDLSVGFPKNMLHKFLVDIITRGNRTEKPDIVLIDNQSPNPANGRMMFQGDHPTDLPWKLDCREF